MKTLYLVALLIIAQPILAATKTASIEFIGPCSQQPLLTLATEILSDDSVGDVTIRALDSQAVPYQGSVSGIVSVFETPTGMDALEVLSDREMRAYGWCFAVDGHSPDLYSDQVPVNEGQKITWWFGFAHLIDDEWVTQCSPSYKVKPSFLCEEDDA